MKKIITALILTVIIVFSFAFSTVSMMSDQQQPKYIDAGNDTAWMFQSKETGRIFIVRMPYGSRYNGQYPAEKADSGNQLDEIMGFYGWKQSF